MDVEEILLNFTHIDEAGFDLTKTRRSHRAVISVSGQHEGNITLCAAVTPSCQNGRTTLPTFHVVDNIVTFVIVPLV